MGGRVWSSAPGSAVRSLTSLDSRRRWSGLTTTVEKPSHFLGLYASSFFCHSLVSLGRFFFLSFSFFSLVFLWSLPPVSIWMGHKTVCFRSRVSCDSVKRLSQMQFCHEELCGFVPLQAQNNLTLLIIKKKCNKKWILLPPNLYILHNIFLLLKFHLHLFGTSLIRLYSVIWK